MCRLQTVHRNFGSMNFARYSVLVRIASHVYIALPATHIRQHLYGVMKHSFKVILVYRLHLVYQLLQLIYPTFRFRLMFRGRRTIHQMS